MKTKQPVLDAALDLFARRGFGETSVQDIGKRANMDGALIIRHFGDKQRLYARVVQLAGDRFLQPMHEHLASNHATLAETLQQWVGALEQCGVSSLIRTGSLANEVSAPAPVVESLNRRLVDFWQRRLSLVSHPLEAPRLRHWDLARLIVAVAPGLAASTKVEASNAATLALTADFAAIVEHMAANSEASTTNGSRAGHAICRTTSSTSPRGEGDEPVSLSPRQLEVLFEVERGASNKGIARELGVTEHTVNYHLKRIYRELSVKRRTEALKVARSRRLI